MKKRIKRLFQKLKYYPLELTYFITAFAFLVFGKPFVFFIMLALVLLLLLIHRLYFSWSMRKVGGYLKNNNTHFFGYRRKGKDLTIQAYIIWRFKKQYEKIIKKNKLFGNDITEYFENKPLYLSLYDYGYGCKVVSIKEFELIKDNGKYLTYSDFIQGATFTCVKKEKYEGLDLILGEAQLGLPNTEHNTLDKYYPWLPVFIALSGHLYKMNILINSQEFERPWIKLRNQQDTYFRALGTFPKDKTFIKRISRYLPFIRKGLYTKVRLFEERQSAENNTLPFKAAGVVNEAGKTIYLTSGQATKEQFEATNGKIKDYYIFTRFSSIRYNTRVHHSTVFGYDAPKENYL